jgi:hypothetical protein
MRLSDFQTAPVVRNLAAEALVAANAGKVHRNFVDYRQTRMLVNPAAFECFTKDPVAAVRKYGRDAVASVTKRQKVHAALDKLMSAANKTEDDGQRLHAALDRWLDSHSEKEPEASDSDEEPEEEAEDAAEENEDPHAKVKIPNDSLSLDQLERTLNKTLGLDDGTNLSRATVMDAIKLGNPDDVASDAIAKFTIGFDVNKPAKIPWFGALRNWVAKYPRTARVRDLDQATLHQLLRELQIAA